jgi:nitrite reductase (NO-forming)
VLIGGGAYGVLGGFDTNTTKRVSGGGTKVVRIALVDAAVGFDVTPDTLVVDPGTHLVADVANEGREVHDLALAGGPRTSMLESGESQRLDLGVVTGDLQAVCTLPGHKDGGMSLDLQVAAPPRPPPARRVEPRSEGI